MTRVYLISIKLISATYRMLRMNHGGLRNRNNGFVDIAGSIFSMCSQLPVTVIFSMGRHIYRRDFTRFSSLFLFLFVTFGKFLNIVICVKMLLWYFDLTSTQIVRISLKHRSTDSRKLFTTHVPSYVGFLLSTSDKFV